MVQSDYFLTMSQQMFGPGSAQNSQGLTFQAFFSSLAVTLVIFGVQMSLFIFLRVRLSHIYEPKTFAQTYNQGIESPTRSLFGWLRPLFNTSLDDVKNNCTLDEYFFLRFLYLLFFIFTCSTFLILPILGTINWLSGDLSEADTHRLDTLDNFSWINIAPMHAKRRIAHLVISLIFVSFISWLVFFELDEYIKIRHKILSSSSHRQKVSSRTILIRSIPFKYQKMEKIQELFEVFPGSIKAVWINRNYNELVKKVDEQRAVARQLERLQNCIIWKSNRVHRLKTDLSKKPTSTSFKSIENQANENIPEHSTNNLIPSKFDTISFAPNFYHSTLPGKKWTEFIKEASIPNIRLPSFQFMGIPIRVPFVGLQIDALTWCKIELNRLNAEIQTMQANPEIFNPINSCFVEFHHQIYAHLTCQSILFENPQLSGQCFIEIDPNDVNWNNLGLSWVQCFVRRLVATILNLLVIVGWTFPVALLAILSQLDYLPELSQAFAWIDYIPARLRITFSAVLPSIAVSSFMGIAPTIFRYLAHIKGYASHVEVELDVQKYLFVFTFIQVFLVISLSRGMTAVVAHVLLSPFSAISLLASNIPKGANFFYSFIFLQGLSLSGDIFLQTGRLIKVYILNQFVNRTPHEKFESVAKVGYLQWGSLYPNITCLAIIGIVYSVIAPLITLFSSLTFGLLFLAYKYRILYCNSIFIIISIEF